MEAETRLIPPAAKRIVEFGCQTGQIGLEFKQIQPLCRYFGIEKDKEKIKQAASVLDGVSWEKKLVSDLSCYGLSRIDCFLYHTSYLQDEDLMEKIRQHETYLAEDGQMIFLLDNVQSIRNIIQIAEGHVPVADTCWSLERFLAGIESLGLVVDEIFSSMIPEWEKIGQDQEIQLLCKQLKSVCNSERLATGALGIQEYVIRVVKKVPLHPLRVISMPSDPVCEIVRLKIPDQFYQTIPGVEVIETTPDKMESLQQIMEEKASILLMQRTEFSNKVSALNTINFMAEKNRVLLHEFDDCPMRWDASYSQRNYIEFRAFHGIQTSTPLLGNYFQQYNPNVLIFPNELEYLPPERAYAHQDDQVTIFYGALNRTEDWQDIMPVLNEVASRYGNRIHFKITADRQFYEALHTSQKEYVGEQYNDGNYAPYDLYKDVLYSADIALLPLKDNLFNRMKSDLKFIESAAHGAVVLASPTVYETTVRDGRTGFLYRNPREFKEWLTLLIENPILRRETAQMAYRYVKENRLMAQHYEERIQAYREYIARQPELERDRQKRIQKWKQE